MECRADVRCGWRRLGPESANIHLRLLWEIGRAAKVSLPELVMAALADGVEPPVTACCLNHIFRVSQIDKGKHDANGQTCWNGGLPATMMKRTTPEDQMSAFAPS